MDIHSISSGSLSAVICNHGAELHSLSDKTEREFIWQAHEAWPRRAPNLFPIVGRLKDDILRHHDREYRMTQHGFARDMDFVWKERTEQSCRLSLEDNQQTRMSYPFRFAFEISYAIQEQTLAVTFRVKNTGAVILPVSFGAHPAFCWPLEKGISKNEHYLIFSSPEKEIARCLKEGLLSHERIIVPIEDRILYLNENLFSKDALIFQYPSSHYVSYLTPRGKGVRILWDKGFRQLGLWSRPNADFLCIEPWHGFASPVGFDGEIMEKPGIMRIPPGKQRKAEYYISLIGGG